MTDETSETIPGEFTPSLARATMLTIGPTDRMFIRFNADGTIDISEGMTPDEAGRQAIEAMQYAFHGLVQTAVAAEREACAKVADEERERYVGSGRHIAQRIAAAIRARK